MKPLALLLAAASLTALAQPSPVIRVNVRLVHMLATVKDRNGQPVTGLDKSAFHVFDNGAPQEISLFEPHTDQPLSVAVLIDVSGSTGIELRYETTSVIRFLNALVREGNPADAAALYSFNWRIANLSGGFTRRIASLELRLKNLKGDAGTSLYDALVYAAEDLEDRDGRHVIIVVTDGGDTTSSYDYHAALRACHNADAVIYPVVVVPVKNDPGRNLGGEHALTTLAEGTGGRPFRPTVGDELDSAFGEILRELRTQYLIGYYPKNLPYTKDRYHRVSVNVDRAGLRVVTRTGYYGDADESGGRGTR